MYYIIHSYLFLYQIIVLEYVRKGFTIPNMDIVNLIHPLITLKKVQPQSSYCNYSYIRTIVFCMYIRNFMYIID